MFTNYQILIDPKSLFGYLMVYLYLFFVGGLIGYLLELFYRRFISMKRWINPGFLKGPCLPLYGCGVCLLHLICKLCYIYLLDPNDEIINNSFYQMLFLNEDGIQEILIPNGTFNFALTSIICIIIVSILLTSLEYLAGLIFIKGFHVRLWDYSKMKGNLQGLICPFYTFIWTIIGTIYWFLLRSKVEKLLLFMIPHMWGTTFILGALLTVFIIDIVNSIKLTASLTSEAKKINKIIDFEKFKIEYKKYNKKSKKRMFEKIVADSINPLTIKLGPKLKKFLYKMKASMYIDNVIPLNQSETPRLKQIDIKLLNEEFDSLLSNSNNYISVLSNASAFLNDNITNINWIGFYLYDIENKILNLGPFIGHPACVSIPYGKGVCGSAVKENRLIRVNNVHEFAGHIACDSNSKSEIVIPILKDNKIFALLDIDSPIFNRFSENDENNFKILAKTLEKHLAFNHKE